MDRWNAAEDVESQLLCCLLGIAEPLVELVEQEREHDAEAEARADRHGEDAGHRIARRQRRSDGRVEHRDVVDGARLRQLCFLISLLEVRVERVGERYLTIEALLFDRA